VQEQAQRLKGDRTHAAEACHVGFEPFAAAPTLFAPRRLSASLRHCVIASLRRCSLTLGIPTRSGQGYGQAMGIKDIGPRPQSFDLETETLENPNYRTVAWSGTYLQVTLMSIPVNGEIGLEKHPDTDQFIRLDRGRGRAQMGPAKDELTFDQEVTDGWCILVPAGSWHNVTNIGDEPMQVYTVYAPQHHKPGKVHQTKEVADTDTDDEPAEWSVQPPAAADEHA
jgi:mannose-6-phosphate isomerase-like protein (cupin superfamily)